MIIIYFSILQWVIKHNTNYQLLHSTFEIVDKYTNPKLRMMSKTSNKPII